MKNKKINESFFGLNSSVKKANKKIIAKKTSFDSSTYADNLFQKDLVQSLSYEEILNKLLADKLFKK
jgi:hypothetical protein